jgi:hypothetical protein
MREGRYSQVFTRYSQVSMRYSQVFTRNPAHPLVKPSGGDGSVGVLQRVHHHLQSATHACSLPAQMGVCWRCHKILLKWSCDISKMRSNGRMATQLCAYQNELSIERSGRWQHMQHVVYATDLHVKLVDISKKRAYAVFVPLVMQEK